MTWITGGKNGYYYNANISTATYALVVAQLFLVVMFFYLQKHVVLYFGNRNSKTDQVMQDSDVQEDVSFFWTGLLLFSWAIFLYFIFRVVGVEVFFSDVSKRVMLQSTASLFSLGVWGSILSFLHAVKLGNKRHIVLSGLLIIITMLIGSRAYIATVLVGVLAMKIKTIKNFKQLFRSNLKMLVLGVLAVMGLMSYKVFYRALRALDFSKAWEAFRTNKILVSIFDIGEFRTVFSLYDYVVVNRYRLPAGDSAARVLSIVPFLNNYIPTVHSLRLSSIAKDEFFQSTYGLGGNFWGESYAMAGWGFVLIMMVIWLLFLQYANQYLWVNSDAAIFHIAMASYCSFYIHRLDWIQVLGCIKHVFLFYLIWMLCKKSFGIKIKTVGYKGR